jgi:hypothetical protein
MPVAKKRNKSTGNSGARFSRAVFRWGRRAAGALLLAAVFSCRPVSPNWEGSDRRPSDVLEPEAFVSLMVDVHLAEGDLLERSLPADEQIALLSEHYSHILASQGIAPEVLQASYAWYTARPLTLNKLYDQVLEELNRMQAEVQAGE